MVYVTVTGTPYACMQVKKIVLVCCQEIAAKICEKRHFTDFQTYEYRPRKHSNVQ